MYGDEGVCDVVFYEGLVRTSLAMETPDCPANAQTRSIYLAEETPLVGFHGMVNEAGMT